MQPQTLILGANNDHSGELDSTARTSGRKSPFPPTSRGEHVGWEATVVDTVKARRLC